MSYYLLNTDGGMVNDGNRDHGEEPGEAAIAVIVTQIKNGREVLIEGFSGAIGPASNDVAEYRALIEGLRFVLSLGGTQVRAYMDSEFIVEQMNSVAGDKSNYYSTAQPKQEDVKKLHLEARQLADRFTSIRISWVPRERNAQADELVKLALPH